MPQWFDRLLGRRRRLQPDPPHLVAVAQHNAYAWPALTTYERQAAVYEHNAWVYVAVNRIAEAAALVPLQVYRRQGERRVALNAHPAERLLAAPNPFLSGFDLIEQTVGALELTGNAYWFLAGDARGRPAEIWPLRPDRVAVVPGERDHVHGYVYTIDGQHIPLEAVEVIHFRRWHPRSDYYGLSALQAARLAIQSDDAMARWNRDTFSADRAVPAGIVNVTEFVSDADFERLKREWRESYGGAERRTAFLRGGAVQWQGIGLSQQDVDFLNGRRFNREEIFHVFGIPPGMWSENATEANATIAERVFVERTLWPKLVRLAGKITAELLPFWGGDLEAAFEDIRPTDVAQRLAAIRTAYPVLSINEIRAQFYDLPPVAWGSGPVSGGGARAQTEGKLAVSVADNEAADPGSVELTPPVKAILRELEQWERWAVRRLGQPVNRPFVVKAVPEDVAVELSARLLLADSAEDIRATFDAARAAVQSPPESA
ncbi:MAG: hypothetical protein Kow0077_14460 [Anaerolineae bacterium]